MKQVFDTDSTLYQALSASTELAALITGGIYVGDRPDDSDKEDITINTLTLQQDAFPQSGVVNVNIHVKDLDVNIEGRPQKKADNVRLKAVSALVLSVIRAYNTGDIKFALQNQTTFQNPEISQHYVNLRIDCIIH